MAEYPHLFTPITLAGHRLKNRIVFGAHTTNMGEDGLPAPPQWPSSRPASWR